jgi:Flp pilus assembly pilin Flp
METIRRFWRDESGISATEYVVLAALIVAGLVTAITAVGANLASFFNEMATWIGGQHFAGS